MLQNSQSLPSMPRSVPRSRKRPGSLELAHWRVSAVQAMEALVESARIVRCILSHPEDVFKVGYSRSMGTMPLHLCLGGAKLSTYRLDIPRRSCLELLDMCFFVRCFAYEY
jgi:hypothetical protein